MSSRDLGSNLIVGAISDLEVLATARYVAAVSTSRVDACMLMDVLGIRSRASELARPYVGSQGWLAPLMERLRSNVAMAWTPEDIAEAMAEFAGVFWPEATIGPVGELVDQIPESHYEFTITDGDRLLTVNVREEEKG